MDALALEALRQVDFNWVVKTDSIWEKSRFDIPEINESVKKELLDDIRTKMDQSKLGWVILGEGGTGKTHLLQSIREKISRNGWGFIMVDLTGVNDFWETTLLGFLDSLEKPYLNEKPQYQIILGSIIKDGHLWVGKLAKSGQPDLIRHINQLIGVLYKKFRNQTQKFHDVIRAIILLNSDDFNISNLGYSWLQGIEIDQSDKKNFGFSTEKKEAMQIVEALCWVMSLRRNPFILAFDQMDSIVMEHHLTSGTGATDGVTDEQMKSKAIIEGISGGLSALVHSVADPTTNIILSCLPSTREILRLKTVSTNKARFYPPKYLNNLMDKEIVKQLVEMRLRHSYEKVGFNPGYPTYPFKREAFEKTEGLSPRNILQYCYKHREECIRKQQVSELDTFSPREQREPDIKEVPELDKLFTELKAETPIAQILDKQKEDEVLGELLKTACQIILLENDLPDNIDAAVNVNVSGNKRYSYLHARIRLRYLDKGDREKHFCIRAILHKHATAFQARLKAAIISSGIDKDLNFRHLLIVYHSSPSAGSKTEELIKRFKTAGGKFVKPGDDELRSLWALEQLKSKNHPDFEKWLRSKRPVSNLPMFSESVNWLFRHCHPDQEETKQTKTDNQKADKNKSEETTKKKSRQNLKPTTCQWDCV